MTKDSDSHAAPPQAPATPDKPVPAESQRESRDVVLVHGPTQDGEGVQVIRARDGQLEAGEMRAVKEGRPLHGSEVVRLHRREGSPLLWDVEVQYDGRSAGSGNHPGPSRVATPAYRDNWDRIFGKDSDGGHGMN